MQYNTLGDTGLIVSRLSLGNMTFGTGAGRYGGLASVDEAAAKRLVDRAIEGGINSFNSGATYGGGSSEEILGRALGAKRKDVVITTKVGFRNSRAPLDGGLSGRSIIQTAEDCLRRLGTDWLDIFALHRLDPLTPIEDSLEALDLLVRQGKVRYVGVANWPAGVMGWARGLQEGRAWAKFRMAELLYTLINRDIEASHLDLLSHRQMGLFVWSPLAGGLLSGKYHAETSDPKDRMNHTYDLPFDRDQVAAALSSLRAIAATHASTPAAVAIAWLLAKPAVTSVLIGVTKIAQLEDNLSAANLTLRPEDMAQLDGLMERALPYPNWFAERNADHISAKALRER